MRIKYLLIAISALSMLVACEGFGGDSAKLKILGNEKHSVELGDEGRASVMFYAPGPWTAKPEYSNSDEPQWMRVEPESGEAGDSLILNIIGVGNRPTDHTYGGKVRITLKDGSDDTKVIVSWKEALFVPVSVESFTLNPSGPLTLKVNDRQVVQIVYSPSNATDPSFRVEKPDGTAAFDIHCPFEGAKDKFQIIAMQAGTGVVNITEASGLSARMEVTVTQ